MRWRMQQQQLSDFLIEIQGEIDKAVDEAFQEIKKQEVENGKSK